MLETVSRKTALDISASRGVGASLPISRGDFADAALTSTHVTRADAKAPAKPACHLMGTHSPAQRGAVLSDIVARVRSRAAPWNHERAKHFVYLYVTDADAVGAEWGSCGIEGRVGEVRDTDYGMREFSFVDTDGTLHRVGSKLR
jgi:hypothetical protein